MKKTSQVFLLPETFRPAWLVFFSILLFGSLSAQVTGNLVLVIVPAQGGSPIGQATEGMVENLKEQRGRLVTDPAALPILRLDPERAHHARVLKTLDIELTGETQVFLCSRSESGWPDKKHRQLLEPGDLLSTISAVSSGSPEQPAVATKKAPPKTTPNSPETSLDASRIGVLLYHDPEDEKQAEQVSDFLKELGRHWMERYSRVEPAPYPLAFYNSGDSTTVSRLTDSLPSIASSRSPSVALCFYSSGRPVEVLEIFPDLQLPATLVRQLSAARTRHLVDSLRPSPQEQTSLPEPVTLVLSDTQERDILLTRLHETAQQLWGGVDDGENGENRLSRKLLLTIIETTRVHRNRTPEVERQLFDALDDFEAEPVLLPEGSEYAPVQERLLELGDTLMSSDE
jgi:hypothetical protein